MVSFENTENAFRARSDSALSRSLWLFRLIGNPALVKVGATLGPMALKLGMKPLIRATIFKQFVGGETIHDCSQVIRELGSYNIGTILDYSVEGKESEMDFDNCLQETLATIEKAKDDKNIPFCVFKVTGLARFSLLEKISGGAIPLGEEAGEWSRVKKRVTRICSAALQARQPVFIDAEESWIQQAIDDLANENMAACNRQHVIVYNTYQLYRSDRLDYLEQSIAAAKKAGHKLGAKLVRGAYMEKERKRATEKGYPSPIQPDKESSDRDYDRALRLCVDNIDMVSICAGTHNEESSLQLVKMMDAGGFSPSDKRFWFSQLYGMSDHISYNLSLNGYNVAKYVPYGPVKEVLPYLIRRAQENTSVKGQTGRELSLIVREKKRRHNRRKGL